VYIDLDSDNICCLVVEAHVSVDFWSIYAKQALALCSGTFSCSSKNRGRNKRGVKYKCTYASLGFGIIEAFIQLGDLWSTKVLNVARGSELKCNRPLIRIRDHAKLHCLG